MESSDVNPLAKKVERILNFSLDQETLNSLSNVSHLISENNLNNRRNLRANIEKQSLLVNEQFLSIFEDTYQNFQKLSGHVSFINDACNKMMDRVEELRLQTSDFLKETSDVNLELRKLANNEKVLSKFCEEFQLRPHELALISSGSSSDNVDENFFEVLKTIKTIYGRAKGLLVSSQHVTGLEIMELMSKYEEMANEHLYRWTIGVLRTINVELLELQPHLLRSMSYLQGKEVLFKHCLDEYTTVRRSAVSHAFIEALTRGRTTASTHHPAIELYSQDLLRYIRDMLSFLHQTVVLEKDMLAMLLRQCNQELLCEAKTVETVLASITDNVARPLKTRIENCLISGSNKNAPTSQAATAAASSSNQRPVERTINYFLAKNVISFYLSTFSQLMSSGTSPLLYTLNELLILSDKVFYNSLNYYCSTNMQPKFELVGSSTAGGLSPTEHLNEFIYLIEELLKYIKSSPSLNEQEHRLETQRILTAVYDPYMQYVIIYSSKLSSIEMTVFSFNCVHSLASSIGKFKFTEEFAANLQKQIDENVDILVNEQFQHLINSLAVGSLYNAIVQQASLGTLVPISTLSGCDHLAVNTFLKAWDRFLASPAQFKMSQMESIGSPEARDRVWAAALQLMVKAYESIYKALVEPANKYADILNLITYRPDEVNKMLVGGNASR